jgi:Ca2+/Na+ antiporter
MLVFDMSKTKVKQIILVVLMVLAVFYYGIRMYSWVTTAVSSGEHIRQIEQQEMPDEANAESWNTYVTTQKESHKRLVTQTVVFSIFGTFFFAAFIYLAIDNFKNSRKTTIKS